MSQLGSISCSNGSLSAISVLVLRSTGDLGHLDVEDEDDDGTESGGACILIVVGESLLNGLKQSSVLIPEENVHQLVDEVWDTREELGEGLSVELDLARVVHGNE